MESLQVNPDGPPSVMKAEPRWCVWKYAPRDGKMTKVPFQTNGIEAKSNDESTWCSFEEAMDTYRWGDFEGIGFMLGGGWAGIDLDGCRNPEDGLIDNWALEHLDQFRETYCEVSPTGTGLKLIVRGSLPTEKTGAQTSKNKGTAPPGEGHGDKKPGIEAYHSGRFFAITGKKLEESPAVVTEYNGELTEWFKRTFADRREAQKKGPANLPDLIGDRRKLIERAIAYLQKCDPAVSGERGHNATFHVACVLVCEFGLSQDEAWQAIQDWNGRCDPPWSESDLRRKLSEADKEPKTLRLRDAELPGRQNGYPGTQSQGDDRQWHTGTDANPDEELFELTAITSAELDSGDFTIEYHITDCVPVRQPGIIGAPSKALKTSIGVNGFMSIATGELFLEKFTVPNPARCCLISAESGFASLQRTGRAIASSRGRLLSDYDDLLWCDQVLDLGNMAHISALMKFVKDNGIKVLGLDPAYLMMPGLGDHANNMFEMGKYLRWLTIIGQECECTPVLIHHFKKTVGQAFEEPELEWLAHAGFTNWARWWWLLNRRSKYDPERRGKHELWLHTGGSAGHASAWALDIDEGFGSGCWSIDVRYASEARQEREEAEASIKSKRKDIQQIHENTKARSKVQNALSKFPQGGTLTDIASVAGVPNGKATAVLQDMLLAKVVTTCAVHKANGRNYDGFILAGNPPGHPDCPGESPGVPMTSEHTPGQTPL